MKQLLSIIYNYWNSIKHNPWFITFRGLFLGAFFSEVQEAYTAGHMTFTITSIEHMIWIAITVALMSLWHLNMPSPAETTTSAINNSQKK